MPDGYVCYDPPADAPCVSPLPAVAQGHVTFGSFNKLLKIRPEVIDVWAEILRKVPTSRLVLKFHWLDVATVSDRIAGLFAERGVARARLEFLGGTSHRDLMGKYQRIDIALDPFPYSGGVTTCEALWMGVPVITCPGETFASRHSLSHLSNVGLTETVAPDLDAYVRLAVALAEDLPRLATLRGGLREQMAASPLCDGPRFAENFMRLLRRVWKAWCGEQTGVTHELR
jgi:predicted O-linked N-acetylglucosamine transferase (SPINDLY family)